MHLVIPFLDETPTLEEIVRRVLDVEWPSGWDVAPILVDDGSAPPAKAEAEAIAHRDERVRLVHHTRNEGKGAALQTGFAMAIEQASSEDVVGVQDADLEYAPRDLRRFVELFQSEGRGVDAIFGNRWHSKPTSPVAIVHRLGNRGLTELSNLATGLGVTDMECCYKVFRAPMLRRMLPQLSESRFAIEPQLAAVLARLGGSAAQVDVDYRPRTFADGKKIGIRDLFAAVATIAREWRKTLRFKGGAAA